MSKNLNPKPGSIPLHSPVPSVGAAQIHLLESLCNAIGVSGDEGPVRRIVLEKIRPNATEIKVDALGNILAIRNGDSQEKPTDSLRLRVMIAAHMDEVGMMITRDEGEGIFRFTIVGGVDANTLPGKSVWVGREPIPGVIGVKPIHLTTREDRRRAIPLDSLRIDVSPDQAKKVKIGDRATFGTGFKRIGPSIRARALDDRIGVASLIELLRIAPAHIDLLAAFTVQEEIGLRGAQVAAYALNPDLAIVLDCTPARDLPIYEKDGFNRCDQENIHYNTRLGGGPAIYIADRATISDPRLVRHLTQTGNDLAIPYQLRQPGSGGTDAGAIHKQRLGIPSISVSVPGRYIHTGATIIRIEDWKNSLKLVFHALERLTPDIFNVER